MLSKIKSACMIGLDGTIIEVEVDVASRGFPSFTIVGLPAKSVDEARDRVRTAIVNASFSMPESRITVNLAPADIPKEGSGFDLPISVGILASSGFINRELLTTSLFVGELSLEGDIRRVPGIISIVCRAKEIGLTQVFIPCANVLEAQLIDGITVFPVASLSQLILHLNGHKLIEPSASIEEDVDDIPPASEFDFAEVRGQEQAKRALEIAAAGLHNVHLKGPPGAGKTMLSRAFPSIMPLLDKVEAIEVMKIYSASGLFFDSLCKVRYPPFRAPHHTTSRVGLVGGGTKPSPGEISLAHRGVLFLDEFPEFPRSVLETLRQPLEDGIVTVSRAAGSLTFPARFLLLAASNPCPCGYLGHPKKRCKCMSGSIERYRKRLSGPLLDRIDLHVDVQPVDETKLYGETDSESSNSIRERVVKARARQRVRYQELSVKTNSHLSPSEMKKYGQINSAAREFLSLAASRLSLSARSYYKVLKVARTIADLQGEKEVNSEAVAEALQFRYHNED
ncbi:YifB family Mg chelatase-like AAA ATPase [Candidatus Roizmanbacteria bacterium]|nr:YifB family Mg chelatase-like AAA ATPase [Candidatus Roizmanbacteria bacterium]